MSPAEQHPPGAEKPALRPEERAYVYIRAKVNQLLTLVGTSPLKPQELDNDTLLELDPIGIIAESFAQVLGHLKETNLQLQRARDEIQAIYDSAGTGILVLDRDMRIVSYNRRQAESFGLEGTGYVGADCCLSMCKRGTPGEKCTFRDVMRSGAPSHRTDWSCGGRDYEVFGTPIRDATGEIVLVVLAYADVTEYLRIQRELRKATLELEEHNEALRALDRLKDELIRDVSHELKTPVAKHLMQLELLQPLIASPRLTDEERRAFEVMRESLVRQQGVIRNLLDLARLEAGGWTNRNETVVLDRLVEGLMAEYRHDLDRYGIEWAVDVPPITLISDQELLWHVVSNVVGNAIKYRRREEGARIVVSAEEVGRTVTIRVADNGIGLTPEEREKVFRRFYQACPSFEGSGIGLSICRRIVDALGGSIDIASEGKGRGTTVTLVLPRSPEAT